MRILAASVAAKRSDYAIRACQTRTQIRPSPKARRHLSEAMADRRAALAAEEPSGRIRQVHLNKARISTPMSGTEARQWSVRVCIVLSHLAVADYQNSFLVARARLQAVDSISPLQIGS